MVRRQAHERGDTVALSHGQRNVTYRALDVRSSRQARTLAAKGIRPGDRVGHLDFNSPELVQTIVSCAKVGAVAVPLNWRLTIPELAALLSDAGIQVLYAGPEFASAAEQLLPTVGCLREVIVTNANHGDDGLDGDGPDVCEVPYQVTANEPVLQIYTSGTTGQAKGVLLTHENVAHKTMHTAPAWDVDQGSVIALVLPLFHIGALSWFFVGVWTGARTILVSSFEPVAMLDLLERERVTNVFLVPTMLQTMCAVDGAGSRDFGALRALGTGAAPITQAALRTIRATFGCRVFEVYGLTETTGSITQLDIEGDDPELLRSVGRPYPWVEMSIVDRLSGQRCETGHVGEVWVRSPTNTPGYFERPADTREALTDDGWLRTGDGGFVDSNGLLFLVDRVKDMIVTGGENVSSIEVEEALCKHPQVLEAAVIGLPDEHWGERVTAVVVSDAMPPPSADELTSFLRKHIAGYKVPKSIVYAPQLPRTPSGKVLKRELRRQLAS